MLGTVFGPLEDIQASIEGLIEKARSREDKTVMDGMIVSEYPDHIISSVVMALHYATGRMDPFTEEHVFNAILFLDKLDTLNLRVTGK